MRSITPAALALIKEHEGLSLKPYLDPVGIWTIGWGHALMDDQGQFLRGPEAKPQVDEIYPEGGITISHAEDLLRGDVEGPCRRVEALVKVPLTDNQFSALVSFEFNTGGLKRSTLLKKLNAGDYDGAAHEFTKWVKGRVDGELVTLQGLVTRRQAEREMFLT